MDDQLRERIDGPLTRIDRVHQFAEGAEQALGEAKPRLAHGLPERRPRPIGRFLKIVEGDGC